MYEGKAAIPEEWEEKFEAELRKLAEHQQSARLKAEAWLLDRPKTKRPGYDLVGWMRDSYPLHDEAHGRAAVRDSQESIEVIAVQESNGEFSAFPWIDSAVRSLGNGTDAPDDEAARVAASCTVSLPPTFAAPQIAEKMIAVLEEAWPMPGWQASRWLKGQLVMAFDTRGNAELSCGDRTYRLHYTMESGLELVSSEEGERR